MDFYWCIIVSIAVIVIIANKKNKKADLIGIGVEKS